MLLLFNFNCYSVVFRIRVSLFSCTCRLQSQHQLSVNVLVSCRLRYAL